MVLYFHLGNCTGPIVAAVIFAIISFGAVVALIVIIIVYVLKIKGKFRMSYMYVHAYIDNLPAPAPPY